MLRVVTEADTALALGSGDVEVLSTPRLLAWCEAATVAAIAGELPDRQTSVGIEIALRHRRSSSIGSVVHVDASIAERDGRRITFDVRAVDDDGELLAQGTIRRAIVDRVAFGG